MTSHAQIQECHLMRGPQMAEGVIIPIKKEKEDTLETKRKGKKKVVGFIVFC